MINPALAGRFRIPETVDVDAVIANSYRDFHCRGLDYLCLRRSPNETIKIYFFDGDVTRLPEVVNPHDHRYLFYTRVLAGASENVIFKAGQKAGPLYTKFEWRTPLNGGNGFTFVGTDRIREMARCRYRTGTNYSMSAEEFHTIRIVENETVLLLRQFEDVVPVGKPTTTFVPGVDHRPPPISHLYSRFTADQVVDRLRTLEERSGIRVETLAVGGG